MMWDLKNINDNKKEIFIERRNNMLKKIQKDYDNWLNELQKNSIDDETDIEQIIEIIEDEIQKLNDSISFESEEDNDLQEEINNYLDNKLDDLNYNLSNLKDLLFQIEGTDDEEKEFLLQEAIEILTEQLA